jgi:hypothetical protein
MTTETETKSSKPEIQFNERTLEAFEKEKLDLPYGMVADKERYDKLLISLRTAYANELSLDKEQTSYSDSLDALRLSLKAFKFE